MRRIAVLTSGGDAPGMNAAVRAVVRAADVRGIDTYGVRDGYEGLIADDLVPLDARAVSGILHLGGTILGTARAPEFREPPGRRKAIANLDERGIEGIVVIGGDGSFRGAHALSEESDVAVAGIAGTIDNDVLGTDFTLGFDTAVNTALESIDKIRDTASSHGRLFFVEVMGRASGYLALYSGLAGGATEVLLPERGTDISVLRQRIREAFDIGKRFCLVVVAEGDDAGGAYEIAAQAVEGLEEVDHRVVTLGHVQRGGSPSMRDRVLGAVLGDAAVQALTDGRDRIMVGEQRGEVVHVPLAETWQGHERSPEELLALMDRLSR